MRGPTFPPESATAEKGTVVNPSRRTLVAVLEGGGNGSGL